MLRATVFSMDGSTSEYANRGRFRRAAAAADLALVRFMANIKYDAV